MKPMRPHNPLIGRILDGLLKEEVKDVLILDIDGTINSLQSLHIAFCNYYGVEVNEDELYKNGIQSKDWDKVDKIKETATLPFPDFSCFDWPFDKRAVANFHKIQEESGIKDIVICSCWRTGHEIEELQEIFDKNGIKGRIIGCTGRYNTRGEEIDIWLQNFLPHVDRFVILDDECDYDIIQMFPNHCVTPKHSTGGLTEENYKQAINILNGIHKFKPRS